LTILLVFGQSALSNISGSANFGSGAPLNGYVDYAVYDPGTLNGINEYVYQYQVFNYQNSTAGIDYFSVGFSSNVNVISCWTAVNVWWEGHGDKDPVPVQLPTSILYYFTNSNLQPGEHSSTLFFSSNCAPEMGVGVIAGGTAGSLNVSVMAPWAVPEPATLGFLIGGAFMAFKRSRNKIRKETN
jgi:hypothetical protein